MPKTQILVLASLLLTACGQAPGAASSAQLANVSPLALPISGNPVSTPAPSASPSPVASSLSVTYYTVTSVVAPLNGYATHTTTMVGHCAIVESNTYCWDDGEHTITVQSGGTFDSYDFTFFGIGHTFSGQPWKACGGDCDFSDLLAPTMIDPNLTTALAAPAPNHYAVMLPAQVLSTGVPTTVTCTDNAGVYTCASITINTTQAGL